AAISRILADLEQLGVKVLDWQNYLEQSQNIWGSDYLQAISCARTFRTAELLLHQRQINPNFWQEFSRCQDSHYWAQLDDETQLNHRNIIQQMQQWSEFGKHLASPWNIVIGGLPNVGKSSLINAILGYKRAIVVDQPGTTRDVVTGETAIDGWPVLLSDTAGQRETGDVLESAGIDRAIQAMQKADLQILLLDRATAPDQQNQILMSKFPEALLVFNKIDIEADPNWNNIAFQVKPLDVSCETGQGIESLIQSIMQKLIPQLPPENLVLPVTSRQQHLLSKLIPLIQ
ncbi:MAG: GTP-binding protein, partial [Planctomycetaceae bacterium]|nr:GTP-binding protein [Planctomycetaceae bacterium]